MPIDSRPTLNLNPEVQSELRNLVLGLSERLAYTTTKLALHPDYITNPGALQDATFALQDGLAHLIEAVTSAPASPRKFNVLP